MGRAASDLALDAAFRRASSRDGKCRSIRQQLAKAGYDYDATAARIRIDDYARSPRPAIRTRACRSRAVATIPLHLR